MPRDTATHLEFFSLKAFPPHFLLRLRSLFSNFSVVTPVHMGRLSHAKLLPVLASTPLRSNQSSISSRKRGASSKAHSVPLAFTGSGAMPRYFVIFARNLSPVFAKK